VEIDRGLKPAILIRRYKRFLADIELESGEVTTIHCPNTGSMKNCQPTGSRVWYSTSDNPKRKYAHTWEIVEVDGSHLVGINTGLANKLVLEALQQNVLPEFSGYELIRSEVAYGEQRSRIDILLQESSLAGQNDCYIEVKNVSLGMGDGLGLFPDAVTTRGQKHLQELMGMREQGYRAVLLFCVQHTGISRLSPADGIDPEYGRLLRQAAAAGVEVLAYGVDFDIDKSTVSLGHRVEVLL
jgi:sugar fermentation stimulation protein A